MTIEEHKKRHGELHKSLDELIADFIGHNDGKMLRGTNLLELMIWSYSQTLNPDEVTQPPDKSP